MIEWLTCAIVLISVPFQAVRIYSKWKCRKKHYLKPINICHEDDIKDLDRTLQCKKTEIEEEIDEMPTEEFDDEIDLFAMMEEYDKEHKSKIDMEYAYAPMVEDSEEMDELEADEFWER